MFLKGFISLAILGLRGSTIFLAKKGGFGGRRHLVDYKRGEPNRGDI